jgi:hypothetical protein
MERYFLGARLSSSIWGENCGARLCPQNQPQRSAVTSVLTIQDLPVGGALRLVFQTQPRSRE